MNDPTLWVLTIRFNFEVYAKEGKMMTSWMRIDFLSLGSDFFPFGAWRAPKMWCVQFFRVLVDMEKFLVRFAHVQRETKTSFRVRMS